jgi:hypothetical protein
MNRLFSRFELCGLTALAVLGLACNPNQSVKPGAPVLTEIKIIENGGASITTISATTPDCASTVVDQGMCDPTLVALCRQAAAANWCRCNANPAPAAPPPAGPNCVDGGLVDAAAPTADAGGTADAGAADAGATADAAVNLGGTWSCAPFAPVSMPLFVFDRVLDTAPFAANDAGAISNVAATSLTPMPTPAVDFTALYNSNGSPGEFVPPAFGDFLSDGPGLLFMASPGLPASTTVAVTLNPATVLAKDGHTAFAPGSSVLDGTLAYRTAALSASVSSQPTPPAPAADAGVCTPPPSTVALDMTPVVLTFNDYVDAATVAMHVTITAVPAPATPITFTATSMDNLNVTITPDANWPASSAITVAVDAATPDIFGDVLGAAAASSATTTFTTSAM